MRNRNGSPAIVALLMVVLAVATSCTAVPDAGPLQAAELFRHAVLIVEVIANAPGYTSEEEIPNESITLLNNTQADIDLVGVTISDEHGTWTIPSSVGDTILEPGEKWTVTGSTYNPARSCYSAICLANKGERLELSYKGVPIDRIRYPACGGSANDGKVLTRNVFEILLPDASETPLEETGCFSITPWGAAREVQGSCYQISVGETDILVDCGSFMGSSTYEDDVFDFAPSKIDAVLITHAHDDHINRLHFLFSQGYEGPVYMTEVTAELYLTKLDDTIHYWQASNDQKEEAEEAIRRNIHEVEYRVPVTISDDIVATFVNAGHIPGSASISLDIQANDVAYSILFSGDIGPSYHPFLNPPDYEFLWQDDATVLVIESTYGDTVRVTSDEPYSAFWAELAAAIEETDLVVIPTLSLDRTQRVLAAIGEGMEESRLPSDLRIAVGGKSSCYFTQQYITFQTNQSTYYDSFSVEFYEESYLCPPFWTYTRGGNCGGWEDYEADFKDDYDIVVTPQGFGKSSLSKRLIERYVGDPEVAFVKVSWAPADSPMGQFEAVYGQDNASITIGETAYPVAARLIAVSETFSGHADQEGLIRFASSLPNLRTIIITHGEPESAFALKERLEKSLPGVEVLVPGFGERIPLLCNL